MAPRQRKHWINAAGLALPWLLALACFATPLFQLLESQWRDQQFRFLSLNYSILDDEPVAIVGIDDEDMVQFGVPGALLHRELGAFMEAMAIARPSVVGLAVLLPASSFDKLLPGLDAALARAMGAPTTPGLINYAIRLAFQYLPLHLVLAWQREGQVDLLRATFSNKAVLLGGVMSFDDHQRTPLALPGWTPPYGTSHGILFTHNSGAAWWAPFTATAAHWTNS